MVQEVKDGEKYKKCAYLSCRHLLLLAECDAVGFHHVPDYPFEDAQYLMRLKL